MHFLIPHFTYILFHLFTSLLSLSHIFYILLQTCQCAHTLIDLKLLHGSLPPIVFTYLLTSLLFFYRLAASHPLSSQPTYHFCLLHFDLHFSKNCESDIICKKWTAHCLITVQISKKWLKWMQTKLLCEYSISDTWHWWRSAGGWAEERTEMRFTRWLRSTQIVGW